MLKKKTILHYLNFYIGLLLVFLIPFGNKILPPIIAIWICSWIIEGKFKTRFSNFKNNKVIVLLLIIFYIWHVIGLLYSDNQKSGLFDLEIKLSIFIFPIIFSGLNSIYYEKFDLVLKSFIIANIFAALMCLFKAFYFAFYYIDIENFKMFFLYTKLSTFIHPTYFAMYLIFCIALIENILISQNLSKLTKILYLCCILFFICFVFLLSSRAGIITLFVICLGYYIYYLINFKNIRIKVISLIMMLVLIILMFFNSRFMMFMNNYYSKSNIKNESKNIKIIEPVVIDESSNVRVNIWKSTLSICTQNFIFGVGSGDVKDVLIQNYEKEKNINSLKNSLNVHNQYVETLFGQGIIGLIILILIFVKALILSFKLKNKLIFIFIIIVGLNFIFESMLNTQAGVVFFSFFYCFLILIRKNPKLDF